MGTLYSTVFDILTDIPSTRDSDRALTEHVYRRLGIDVNAPWTMINADAALPSLESIGRLRRKAQELNPELAPKHSVKEIRKSRREDFKDFSKVDDNHVLEYEEYIYGWQS